MESFRQTLNNLREGAELASQQDLNVLTLTGLVGLFELCFEQAWKVMKKVLQREGFLEARSGSPTTIIKLAFREGLIRDETAWLAMLDDRRLGVRTYNEVVALDVADAIPQYARLFEQLQNELDSRWRG